MSRSVDLTVNIRGNSSGLRDAVDDATRVTTPPPNRLDNVGGGAFIGGNVPSGDNYSTGRAGGINVGSIVPTSDRMVADVRREMQQRGVVMVPGSAHMQQIIAQYSQTSRSNVNSQISEITERRRESLRERLGMAYDDVDAYTNDLREQTINANPERYADKEELGKLDAQLEELRSKLYQSVSSNLDREEEDIDRKEQTAREQAEKELTAAIQKLVEHFERTAESGETSYMDDLRQRQAELIDKRDNARSREEALDYSRQLNDVNREIRNIEGGGEAVDDYQRVINPVAMAMRGANRTSSSLQNKDLGGAISGFGNMTMALAGVGGPYGAAIGAGIEALGAIAKGVQSGASSFDNARTISALTQWGYNLSNRERSQAVVNNNRLYELSEHDVDPEKALDRATQITRVRREVGDWDNELFKQIVLERSLGMEDGKLVNASRFDRYGTNVTDALIDMTNILRRIKGSGVSENDFTKVEEKFVIQQGIMEGYKAIQDRPEYSQANRIVAAFSASGVTQDERLSGDIKAMQDMIRNPVNERADQILHDVITKMFPETQGRIHRIDEIKATGKDDPKLMSAYVKRLVQEYGDMESETGYFALKQATKGMISPERLRQYVQDIRNGDMGRILEGSGYSDADVQSQRQGDYEFYAKKSSELLSRTNELLGNIASDFKKMFATDYGFSTTSTPQVAPSASSNGIRGGRR